MLFNKDHWSKLLVDSVNQPGAIMVAYKAFHNYSLGNMMMAYWQLHLRNIPLGPINTYKGWQGLGRTVKRGEKAITLCMPVTVKQKDDDTDDAKRFTIFVEKPRWFVLAQTEGEDQPTELSSPEWSAERALAKLDITQVPFDLLEGNTQGYARKRTIAINPVAQVPHKTRFHELGHIVLGHTKEADFEDSPDLTRNLREVEAESVALLCLESLDLPGSEFCRGYIQNWIKGDVIPEKSAQRIFKAANTILTAGANNG